MSSTLIVTEFVTLDGVMEAPGGEPTHVHTGWVGDLQSPEQVDWKFEETSSADVLLIGRVTYESFAGAWPNYEGAFADQMNAMPKVVVSSTLTDPEWHGTTVLDAPDGVADGIRRLKDTTDGTILVTGSIALVHLLLEEDLVDELRLMVFPVTIGSGRRLFPHSERKVTWVRTATESFPSGIWVDTFRPA